MHFFRQDGTTCLLIFICLGSNLIKARHRSDSNSVRLVITYHAPAVARFAQLEAEVRRSTTPAPPAQIRSSHFILECARSHRSPFPSRSTLLLTAPKLQKHPRFVPPSPSVRPSARLSAFLAAVGRRLSARALALVCPSVVVPWSIVGVSAALQIALRPPDRLSFARVAMRERDAQQR